MFIIVILVVFATLFFSLNDELSSTITKHSLFRIGGMVVLLYFAYNNLTDGCILLCFIVLIALGMKPELKDMVMTEIEKYQNRINGINIFPNKNLEILET